MSRVCASLCTGAFEEELTRITELVEEEQDCQKNQEPDDEAGASDGEAKNANTDNDATMGEDNDDEPSAIPLMLRAPKRARPEADGLDVCGLAPNVT